MVTTTGAGATSYISSSKLLFNANTGILSATSFVGSGISLTGSTPVQVFGATSNLFTISDITTGSIFSVNNVSGIPYIDVNATTNVVALGPSSGNVGIGTTNPTEKLQVQGNILASGTITAGSDIKLKINIQTIPNALDKVLQLRGVEFDRIDMKGEHQIGVIAQEVEKIIPEVVYGEETKSVAYGNLVSVLIEAIKELTERVIELENK
jgi:hypothetical protein